MVRAASDGFTIGSGGIQGSKPKMIKHVGKSETGDVQSKNLYPSTRSASDVLYWPLDEMQHDQAWHAILSGQLTAKLGISTITCAQVLNTTTRSLYNRGTAGIVFMVSQGHAGCLSATRHPAVSADYGETRRSVSDRTLRRAPCSASTSI
ncbi:hypothetical protein AUEXF2481DRAFT_25211 [Aureobasidium subglaciale EXF-2481]|uniref:Uncharacterized protein n=1 Tax=Aureobasidium subglaciale (strain EXF-2481) TaxID=1043005 RepID=A0A074YT18_AURSE|nr:uncharacterized protein AUEXF2481DRAFT_25211 [Aureobasidium subglaciale EXF-2481]KEQ99289.1 hypothetical protein AUEXF2481DRAFT_25211 [Aureobasidium subglaciale EXF-2481]